MRSWEMSTLVVNAQIRAFRPTSILELIWCYAVVAVMVVGGQKIFDSLLIPWFVECSLFRPLW